LCSFWPRKWFVYGQTKGLLLPSPLPIKVHVCLLLTIKEVVGLAHTLFKPVWCCHILYYFSVVWISFFLFIEHTFLEEIMWVYLSTPEVVWMKRTKHSWIFLVSWLQLIPLVPINIGGKRCSMKDLEYVASLLQE
jgi:hypothetical protein